MIVFRKSYITAKNACKTKYARYHESINQEKCFRNKIKNGWLVVIFSQIFSLNCVQYLEPYTYGNNDSIVTYKIWLKNPLIWFDNRVLHFIITCRNVCVSRYFCVLFPAMLSCQVSLLIICFMSVERFVTIAMPYQPRWLTKRRALLCLAGLWIFGECF